MKYLDASHLNSLDAAAFQRQTPYPWANPAGLVTQHGYQQLRDNPPDFSLFKKLFGKQRKHGQQSHDRYSLIYQDGLPVPDVWQEFIAELRGDEYGRFIREHFGVRSFDLRFIWFFTPAGCSVSPHCDHYNKIGVHLFYLNTDTDWKPEWGGETLVLGSAKSFKRTSAPQFGDFSSTFAGKTTGTHSLFFKRTSNSWHGVREITCPEGYLRKVFMVSFQHTNIFSKTYHMLTT